MTSNIFAVAFVMVSRETTQSLWPPGSLSNAKIGKDSIENVFVVYQPSDLIERLARIVEIDGNEFGGKTIAQRRRRMAQRAFGANRSMSLCAPCGAKPSGLLPGFCPALLICFLRF